MLVLVDTNLLVYRHDPRDPRKQRIAVEVLRAGIERDDLRLPHQAVLEFVAATTRPLSGGSALLSQEHARHEAEAFLHQFVVLYPNEDLVRSALRGMAAYRMGWFDAHLWAYADVYGIPRILSEDFQHGRLYGSVEVVNPFLQETD